MLVGDQSETIRFLKKVSPADGSEVELVSTHASLIFLARDRALKLKRAVRYPYLNFSSPERRLACCRAELELNRRTAPQLYLAVRTITREADGRLAFDGAGTLVDAVVEMRRFSQENLFDTMAQKGALTPQLMTDLARQIAKFHKSAAISFTHGGVAGISAVLDINDRALRGISLVTAEEARSFAASFRQALIRHSDRLEARRRAGKVRRCHGDLILRNICLIDSLPTLFDCLEFNEDLATIDVLYDLAFLLMDLWHRDQRELANIVFNRYLDECEEMDGLPLLPFFMAIRAAVRAHVTATQALDAAGDAAGVLLTEARAYFGLATSLLSHVDPLLLAVGGFSGSGKSTVASLVAPHIGPAPGARTLNSDRIRKRVHGVRAEERLPESAYRPEISEMVYETLRREAAEVLTMGSGVVIDAVFDRPDERRAIQNVVAAAGIPFHGIWLEAPTETLLLRMEARRSNPSDATAEVLAAQLRRDIGEIVWQRIDASGDPAETRRTILASLSIPS
ncbi:AAA family ATPase [Microvirga sp. 2TAF3]|uniref:bifunctional aminoglycoside phosphotransferase/ATP-binding protein n=1 Tax=Microvirga sp. 2TAF3 TaxID=3233014 RepID=UPI003F98852E